MAFPPPNHTFVTVAQVLAGYAGAPARPFLPCLAKDERPKRSDSSHSCR